MKVITSYYGISSDEVRSKFNNESLTQYINNCVKPVIEQYEELGLTDEIKEQLSTNGSFILFDNPSEMYTWLEENNFQTDEENDNATQLYEVSSDTEYYRDFVYILDDSGMPDSAIAVAHIK